MSQNSTDLRVRRTQKLLREAFIELVLKVGFEAITVQMLSERAMINRATFYRHYEDKFDLAERVYADLTAEYAESIQAATSGDPLEVWCLLFEHVSAYADFYLGLLLEMPRFQERVRDGIEQQTHAELLRMGLDESKITLPLPLILRYLATAQMGIIQWWLEAGQPIPIEEMAQHLKQLHLQGATYHLHLPMAFA